MTLVPPARALPSSVPAQRGGPLEWWRRRREAGHLDEMARYLAWQWDDTVDGANLVHRSATAAGIGHTSRPEVWWVEQGPPLTLIVRMLPGQVLADFEAQAHRIAEGMACRWCGSARTGTGGCGSPCWCGTRSPHRCRCRHGRPVPRRRCRSCSAPTSTGAR